MIIMVIIIIIMESFLAPFGSHVNQYSNEVLRIYFHKNSTGLLYKREKKKKKKRNKQNTVQPLILYLTPVRLLLRFWVLFCVRFFFFFNGSNLSLQAIYKDVNSKAYLLRLSSFLIYIYTIVHLIYFFSIQFLTVVLFWFMRFFKSFSQNFFIQVFFFLLINNNFLWSFKNRSCFTQKKVMSDSSEIFCHC